MGHGEGDFIAGVIAAGIASGLLSRLCLWLASSLGHGRMRLVVAHLVTLLATVTAAAFLFATVEGVPDLRRALIVCMPGQLLWLIWDLGALRRRARTPPGDLPEEPGSGA